MPSWSVQDAKARFSELLDRCLEDGPQIVTRRGVEMAVVAPVEQWRRLQQSAQPTLKELLLGDGPRFDLDIPPRSRLTRRPPVVLD